MDAKRFLIAQRVARLATVSAESTPHIVPVVYAYDSKHIYIALDEKRKRVAPMRLKRVQNISANQRIALLVDRHSEDSRRLAWGRADGVARILRRSKTHASAIKLLRTKYPQYRKMNLDARPVIGIAATRVV